MRNVSNRKALLHVSPLTRVSSYTEDQFFGNTHVQCSHIPMYTRGLYVMYEEPGNSACTVRNCYKLQATMPRIKLREYRSSENAHS